MRMTRVLSQPSFRHETEQFGYRRHLRRSGSGPFVKSSRAECGVVARPMEYPPLSTMGWFKTSREISGSVQTPAWCAGRLTHEKSISRGHPKGREGKTASRVLPPTQIAPSGWESRVSVRDSIYNI